jgi:sterol desaturase/sphingolipid hydroxylase (fatty acid hydroxylase superfamily)
VTLPLKLCRGMRPTSRLRRSRDPIALAKPIGDFAFRLSDRGLAKGKIFVRSTIGMVWKEEASLLMVEFARWFLSGFPLFVLTAIGTHLVMSSSQTLFHYGLGHHRIGGTFYRNHIRFHHAHYAKGHLMSSNYRGNEGNNTRYFLIPTILVAGGMFLVLPFNLFVVVTVASTASFGAHVYLDKQYHTEKSSLTRFAWFRRKQQLHFVHHLHANSNFAVIDFFWDRLLGTYRNPDTSIR